MTSAKRKGAEPAKTSRARVPQPREHARIVPPNAPSFYARHAEAIDAIGELVICPLLALLALAAIGCMLA